MNKETKLFVAAQLNRYNSFQNVVDIEAPIFDNTYLVGTMNGSTIELDAQDAIQMIKELCEALNVLDEGSK